MIIDLLNRYKENILAIDDDGQSISYGDVLKSVEQMEELSYRPLVFLMSENKLWSLIAYLSCLAKRWVPLMLDAKIDKDLLADLLEIYKPNYIWNNTGLIKLNEQVIELKSDLGLLLTTSGSTGSPKLVRLSYDNIWSNASSIAQYLEISKAERPILALPMYYSFGLSVINSHILNGATILLTDKSLMQKEFWSFVKEQKASTLSGVPYTYEMLNRLRFTKMDLPDLKTLCQAGGKLNDVLIEAFAIYAKEKNKRFFVMYGQTEATARMSYLPSEITLRKIGSIGVPIPGGSFSLAEDGELIYKGNNVSLGYADCVFDLAKGDENLGVLFTGDVAKKDSEGYYYIVGRKKRFIKLFGNRVNLDAAEQLIKVISSEVACVGIDDKMTICMTDETKMVDVKSYISHKLGIHSSAFQVKIVKEIPKNSSGKILYRNLECEI